MKGYKTLIHKIRSVFLKGKKIRNHCSDLFCRACARDDGLTLTTLDHRQIMSKTRSPLGSRSLRKLPSCVAVSLEIGFSCPPPPLVTLVMLITPCSHSWISWSRHAACLRLQCLVLLTELQILRQELIMRCYQSRKIYPAKSAKSKSSSCSLC